MLIEEARWFGQKIAAMDPASLFPLCNVGSSTDRFRRVEQPWIDEFIFRPARERGLQVVHMDVRSAPGVDVVGDLSDPPFLATLSDMGFQSVFCSNLLEHVTNRESLCKALVSLIRPGGHILVSVPYQYPFHLDPIDTGFRPDIEELASLFPSMHSVDGEIVTGGTYLDSLRRSPLVAIKTSLRILTPFYRPRAWLSVVCHLPWLSRHYQVTCLILVRQNSTESVSTR